MDPLAALDRQLADHAERAPAVLRVGLGLVILLEGAHKLVEPAVWAAYAAPWVELLWPAPMVPTMVVNGVVEVGFGLALLADRYTAAAATVVALSIAFVVVNLATVGLTTGAFVDVAIRDVGLVALATGVALQAPGDG
ncbi:MAG: DoxX family membrane protein [Halobacteriales archaeon]